VLSRQCLNRRIESFELLESECRSWNVERNGLQKGVDSLRIYNNGVMVTAGDAADYMKVPGLVHLGTRAMEAPGTETFNDSFEGALDDFRIYSYALSPSDALGLANVASHYYDIADPPTSSEADLYDDNKIEFKDMTVLGDEWLDGPILWP